MEYNKIIWYAIAVATILLLLSSRKKSGTRRLPPGPPGLPVFGNLFDLKGVPHQSIANLRINYGPVVWLRLGSVRTLAVQSAKEAAELFKNHDVSFAGRTLGDVMHSHGYCNGSLVMADYGSYWRLLRRICSVQMFMNKRVNETMHVRRKCVDELLRWIEKERVSMEKEKKGSGVDVAWFAFLFAFNMLGNQIFSRDLADPDSKNGLEFYTAMMGVLEYGGTPNISDVFPWLRWLDLQNLRRKTDRHMGVALRIISSLVKERMQEERRGISRKTNDFLDVLLNFEGSGKDEPDKLTEHQINICILEMFLAGTETASSSVEWAMTELFRHPKAMAKLKREFHRVVGPDRRFEESDIDNMEYLQAVVKETLRLHPPVPLLIPRRATEDTKFMDYDIPKDTQVFVNVWAIGRDPECWEDPLSFKPERFLGSEVDFKGQNFGLIPFGAGRRICVAFTLGNRMLHFVLGSLLHAFDWELESNMSPQTLDVKERLGITVRKYKPLMVIPKKVVSPVET